MYSLGELADLLGLTFSGEPTTVLSGLASLENAGPSDLTFLADVRHSAFLAKTQAAAVILRPESAPDCPTAYLESPDPYLSMAQASALLSPRRPPSGGCHPSAVISEAAEVSGSASIGPQVVVEDGAVIEDDAVLHAGVFVGANSRIGARTHLLPQVVVYHGVRVGSDCTVHSQAVLGADGFGFARGTDGWLKQPQLGGVTIGNGVEIGACTTIDRGTFDDTVIGDGVIVDNQVQIAHNCRIGRNTAIAGCTGLAGSTIVGANCTLAGGVGVVGHLQICDNVHVTSMTMVTRSILEPGSYSGGTPFGRTADWKRNAVRFSQLDRIQQRLAALEKGDGLSGKGE